MSSIIALHAPDWIIINDGVMGGVSSSKVDQTEQGLRFSGTLSLDNNGGFASTRLPITSKLNDVHAVHLRVRGDGRTYQFRIRTNDRFDGIAWTSSFTVGPEWETIVLPLDSFEPTFRGRVLNDTGPLNTADIRQIGILIADKQERKFQLEIATIAFMGEPEIP